MENIPVSDRIFGPYFDKAITNHIIARHYSIGLFKCHNYINNDCMGLTVACSYSNIGVVFRPKISPHSTFTQVSSDYSIVTGGLTVCMLPNTLFRRHVG